MRKHAYRRPRRTFTRLRGPETRWAKRAPAHRAESLSNQDSPWYVSEDQRRAWALARRRRIWVRRQLRETLPRIEGLAIELRFLKGLSLKQCAAVLQVHPANVPRIIERGIRRLQKQARQLRNLWPDGPPVRPASRKAAAENARDGSTSDGPAPAQPETGTRS